MKKRISILLAALLVFSLAAPALAAHIDLDTVQDGDNEDGYKVENSNITVSHESNTLSGGDGSYSLNFIHNNASVELTGDAASGNISANGNLTITGDHSLHADGRINVNDTLTIDGGADVTGIGDGPGVYASSIVVEDGSLTGKDEGSAPGQGIRIGLNGTVTIGDKVYTETEFDALAECDSTVTLTHTPQGESDSTTDDGITKLTGSIPAGHQIVGFSDKFDSSKWLASGTMGPGGTLTLPITPDMFLWTDADGNGSYYADDVAGVDLTGGTIQSSQLKNIGLSRVYQKSTSGTVKSVEIKNSKSVIEIKFVDYYAKTSSTDVELKLALTYKGSTNGAPEYELNFTMENEEEIIEEGQEKTYSYGNIHMKADATVRNLEFEGDEDGNVFATKTVVKGQKYYFNVTSDLSFEDEKIIAKNPEIGSIYTVYQVNMEDATIQFKDLDQEYSVYDEKGQLLGTTEDKALPFSNKYLLI